MGRAPGHYWSEESKHTFSSNFTQPHLPIYERIWQHSNSFEFFLECMAESLSCSVGHFKMTWPLKLIWWRHQMEIFPALLALCSGRGIQRSPVNSQHKGQWHGTLMFSLICAWINGWVNNREAGDLRCHLVHYDVTVMGCYIRTKYHGIWVLQEFRKGIL